MQPFKNLLGSLVKNLKMFNGNKRVVNRINKSIITGNVQQAETIINNEPIQRYLDSEIKTQILEQIPKNSRVLVFWQDGDNEILNFSNEIVEFLKVSGCIVGTGHGSMSPIVFGYKIYPIRLNNISGYKLDVGYKPKINN